MKQPYYSVIFSSQRSEGDQDAYGQMAVRMLELAQEQKGFLGMESVRGNDGKGITVSYWASEADIATWKAHSEHKIAQEFGRSRWYDSYTTRVCKVEREYSFSGPSK